GGPDSPRHQFRALRQNPENALLHDTQFDRKYGLASGTTSNILGPKSGERNAGVQAVSESTRNSILANGGPDIGFNPKGDLDFRRKLLMLIPDQSTVAEAADKAPGIDSRPLYPIGGPGSPRHEFRALRQNPENALLKDAEFDRKYGLVKGVTGKILGPQSGERNAGSQGISEATRNSILAKGGPDIGVNPRGSLDRRRKVLSAAAGEEPAKRPRLDTGLQNEPSMSVPFMAHQSPFAGQSRQDEAGPSSRPLPPFPERPGSGERPAAAPQGGGHRSPSPDPQQDYIDAILQSFKEY
ncbi:MAG TPA: hypothetical protein VK465_10435, partial [Fibrobacteria bacterium]|nr:hypothetical protein [Fibrobacteria bacterium]